MKLFFSEFKGHQIYNPTVDFVSLGLDAEKNTRMPHPIFEELVCYKNAIIKCQQCLGKKLYLLSYKESNTPFGRIDRYKGVKRQLESCMPNSSIRYDDIYVKTGENKYFLYSGASVDEGDIECALSLSNTFLWLGIEDDFIKLMDDLPHYDTPRDIKNELLMHNCILIELLDLGIDGNTLFFLATLEALHKIETLL